MSGIELIPSGGKTGFHVPLGQTIIGRGPFLQIIDKRVSRKHAILQVDEDGTLQLTPIHVNPCFLIRADCKQQSALSKDISHPLHHGDVISLLPDGLSFTVSYKEPTENEPNSKSDSPSAFLLQGQGEDLCEPSTSKSTHSTTSLPCKTNTGQVEPSVKVTRRLPDWMLQLSGAKCASTSKKSRVDKSEDVCKSKNKLSVHLDDEKSKRKYATSDDEKSSGKHLKVAPQTKTKCVRTDKRQMDEPSRDDDSNIHRHREEEEEERDMMVHPENNDIGPGDPTSNKQAALTSGENVNYDGNKVVRKTNETSRRPCRYGTKCYRKNPVHFAEFSHPGDESYDDNSSEESEDKTNRKTALREKDKRSLLAGQSDDDGKPNTYDYNDSFLDDIESESTGSHLDLEDEESDWEPDEDIADLMSEASEFKKNKRMQQTT